MSQANKQWHCSRHCSRTLTTFKLAGDQMMTTRQPPGDQMMATHRLPGDQMMATRQLRAGDRSIDRCATFREQRRLDYSHIKNIIDFEKQASD